MESSTDNRIRPRLLIFIVAYNAEKTITWVLDRIPQAILELCDVEVLMIDDASKDQTFRTTLGHQAADKIRFPIHVLRNPVNQGYGGNQKIGYHFAIEKGFDFVALVHGDGQYAPERLPDLVRPLLEGQAEAVFGSRMISQFGALKGGMPLYKFVGNRILTFLQNRILKCGLSEFHTGYRVYATKALARVPFELNTNDFHFDTEIIIQFVRARHRIVELPIPTYYGDEISHVNGLRYAWDVVVASLKARAQDYGLYYDRKFDCEPTIAHDRYVDKSTFDSTHAAILERVPAKAVVVDVGCGPGHVSRILKARGHRVIGIDLFHPETTDFFDRFHVRDLDADQLPKIDEDVGAVLLLDVIEHLKKPEAFVDQLRAWSCLQPNTRIIASTGNIAFATMRLQLLLGSFNYGKRGLLDLDHKRLFTPRTFRALFSQAGFDVVAVHSIPAPFPLVFGNGLLGRALQGLNRLAMRASRNLFAFQVVLEVRPRPTLDYLLRVAYEHSAALQHQEDTASP
jgi:glycosyltransferase involved in cell wall biosynthesis